MRAALQSEYDKEMSGKYIHEMIPFADWLAQRNAPTGKAHGGQPNLDVMRLAIGGQGPKNWLKGSVEQVIEPLKGNPSDNAMLMLHLENDLENAQSLGLTDRAATATRAIQTQKALHQWIDRNLANYIKKQMATHDDPIRKLAEQGIFHIAPEQVGMNRYNAHQMRAHMNGEKLAKSPDAEAWEDAADVAIGRTKVKNLLGGKNEEPWMQKTDPETHLYYPRDEMHAHYLGFDHIVDVLKQDLAEGRIRPEQLSKVSIEHAVRRTHEYDQERKKAMAETALKATEGMPVHKDYGDGFRWIELTKPAIDPNEPMPEKYEARLPHPNSWGLFDKTTGKYVATGLKSAEHARQHALDIAGEKKLAEALKYEGDTMGHCVGGYCPDVSSGETRIFSLRDAKNEPHVTIEVRPPHHDRGFIGNQRPIGGEYYELQDEYVNGQRAGTISPDLTFAEWWRAKNNIPEIDRNSMPPSIRQIKGKGNAKPKKDYIPYVQDFVRSGNWSEVNDFRNTDLIRKSDLIDKFSPEELDAVGKGEYLTHGEHSDLLLKALQPPKGKAHGGITHAHHLEIEERRL